MEWHCQTYNFAELAIRMPRCGSPLIAVAGLLLPWTQMLAQATTYVKADVFHRSVVSEAMHPQ